MQALAANMWSTAIEDDDVEALVGLEGADVRDDPLNVEALSLATSHIWLIPTDDASTPTTRWLARANINALCPWPQPS